jgi:MoaA/NifB/PqqE/SkfB family radical SAM enzyme
MYNYDELFGIHLELTSRCNLRCPQCGRNDNGTTLSNLPLTHMSLELVKKIFNEMNSKISYIHICGNYGDVVAYPWLNEAIDIMQQSGVQYIKLYTNASAKTTSFWEELGTKLGSNKGQIVFSIDGLEDTNHLYRVGSNWKKVMENAQAFINAGGDAVWEWLPFEHNDHQVEEAAQLANTMGFKQFILKKNPRFSPLINENNHTLKPSKLYVHEGIKKQEGLTPTLFPISCKYKKRKMIYIDFEGYLLPCCWHGNRFKNNKSGKNQFQEIMDGYGSDIFDLKLHSIEDVLNNAWYKKDMEYTVKILDTCRQKCTLGSKMSNKDNRIEWKFQDIIDLEPWE